jgi:catechol 2,3-dioxygenase-like lactoylglutathione lyase family enzyme
MKLPPLPPELTVSNLERSLDFYIRVLGFSIAFERREERFATVCLDGAFLMLDEMTEHNAVSDSEFVEKRAWRTASLDYPYGRGMNFLITVKDISALYDRVKQANYPI